MVHKLRLIYNKNTSLKMERKDLNSYYDKINELIDEYIDKWKIKPTRLKRYLKPGTKRFDNFLKRNNLFEIKGARTILKDAIEDRVSLEKDGILKFESYKLFESDHFESNIKECLIKGVGKADLEMEKILADEFDTNLSGISIIDSEAHKFKVETWSDELNVIIYSYEDFEIIKENFVNYYYDNLGDKIIEKSLQLKLKAVTNEDIFTNSLFNKLTDDTLKEKISNILNLEFKSFNNNHYIFY